MYDAIVVGARCAGSAIALLLARRGYRVLLLDRATFPSDMPTSAGVGPMLPRVTRQANIRDSLVNRLKIALLLLDATDSNLPVTEV